MTETLNLVSINRGKRERLHIGSEEVETGICKRPVAGEVRVGTLGLEEDAVVNTVHHGGPDQALYLYSLEDYAWWSEELLQDLPCGIFGENLTLSGFGPRALRIGDRLRLREVLLEVCAPRVPCATFGARMRIPGFVKRFVQASRPGAYARVLQTGVIQQGDSVELLPTKEDYPTVVEIFDLWHSKTRDAEAIRRALAAPLAVRTRAACERWLGE